MCLCVVGLTGYAQSKGDMAVGLNLGVAPLLEKGISITNFGIGAKFQYNVTNPIRLEADVDYWFKDKGLGIFDISANAHYLFHIGNKLSVYPLIGIGYANVSGAVTWDYDLDGDDDWSSSMSRFLFNVGAGAEYNITRKISAGLEIKYQYMKNFSRLPITIGATYHF